MSFELSSKRMRRFSTAFKKEKVDLIIRKKLTIKEVCKVYKVSSTSVYNWLHEYGKLDKTERMVVEKISESAKSVELLKYIHKLESEVGRLHLENVLQARIIECGSDLIGEDLKKKFYTRQ